MSITDVNTAPGQNTCVLSKPSIHKHYKSPQAIHNYCESSQMKPAAILYILLTARQHRKAAHNRIKSNNFQIYLK